MPYEVPVGVAIWANVEQPEPVHRSTLYAVTFTLSVAAVQVRRTDVLPVATAEKLPGALGGVVSPPAAVVVAWAIAEYGPRLPAASVALTR